MGLCPLKPKGLPSGRTGEFENGTVGFRGGKNSPARLGFFSPNSFIE